MLNRVKRQGFLLLSLTAAAALFQTAPCRAESPISWISLYDGNEAHFSGADRAKVLQALEALGIDHKDSGGREILVNAGNRVLIRDLVAEIFTKSSHQNTTSSR